MKKLLFIYIALICASATYAQHTIKLSIKSLEDRTALAGATAVIGSINKTAIADSLGIVSFSNIAAGTF